MTPDSSVLQALREGVGKATGPSLDLDHAIQDLFSDGEPGAPFYTASTDEALALIERVRPRWEFALSVECPGDGAAPIWWVEFGDPFLGWNVQAPTVPLALISALLAALSDTGEA